MPFSSRSIPICLLSQTSPELHGQLAKDHCERAVIATVPKMRELVECTEKPRDMH